MSVNFNSNVGYAPLRSNSNVNFAQRNENMEAPKKSNTKKYVAAGVGLAALAAAVVFRKPIGNALQNLMGTIKMPKFKMPDFSKLGQNLKTGVTDFSKNAKVKADALGETVSKAVKDAAANVTEKFTNTTASFKLGNMGETFGRIWKGVKGYAEQGYKFVKDYVMKAVNWIVNLFHKPVEVPTNVAGLLK